MNLFGGFYQTSSEYQQAPKRNVQAKKRYHHASSAAAWYYTVHLVFQLHRSWYCSNFSIKPISGDGTLICTTESCIIRRIHLWVLQVRHFPFQSSTFVRQGTFSYLLCILLLFWKASAVRERGLVATSIVPCIPFQIFVWLQTKSGFIPLRLLPFLQRRFESQQWIFVENSHLVFIRNVPIFLITFSDLITSKKNWTPALYKNHYRSRFFGRKTHLPKFGKYFYKKRRSTVNWPTFCALFMLNAVTDGLGGKQHLSKCFHLVTNCYAYHTTLYTTILYHTARHIHTQLSTATHTSLVFNSILPN